MKILFFICALLSFSCKREAQNTKTVNNEALVLAQFDGDSFKIVNVVKETKTLATNYTFSVDLDGVQAYKALEQAVNKAVYEGLTPQAYAEKLDASCKADYADTVPIETESWWYTEEVKGKKVKTDFVQFEKTVGAYTGGAHPVYNTSYYVFDKKRAKQLFLSDFVEDNEELRTTLEAALCAYYEKPEGTPLNEVFGSFEPHLRQAPINFYLSEEGMGFFWNQYEIAPYASGPIDIVVPYKQLGLK